MRGGLSPACAASEAGFYDQSHLSGHFKTLAQGRRPLVK